MKGTIPCGRWAGIPIGIHWSALAAVALIAYMVAFSVLPGLTPGLSAAAYWMAGTAAAVLLMVSLLAHELAHTATALRSGMRVRAMTLWLLGGQTELDGDAPNPRTELRIALAGPLASAAVGGVFAGLTSLAGYAGWPPVVRACLAWLALVNLILAAFNLLPAVPMDGGRVLHALLWRRRSTDRATAITALVGRLIGSLFIGFGVVILFGGDLVDGMWLGLLGWFLLAAAAGEEVNAVRRNQFSQVFVRDVMAPADTIAPAWFTVDTFLEQVASAAHRRVFAVIDFSGQPFGVLSLAMLTSVPVERLRTARVADVCRKLADTVVVAPDSTLADLLAALQRRGGAVGPALVIDNGTMVGTIGDDDIARAVELALLRQSSGAAAVAVRP
ncbi:site-2 protease family protein [Kutzneria buriramensis]|uniref:Zinc metalloprotease n=1 Tax=Kutzneria buriramensis TaxID=1045776 RepID=A0A3E0GZR2_9PSEU|nr:site-2 protease family protein [Kutzneria buriramensis]REH34854.1 Zn-dependent protease [Kutzneria buriramensis]